MAALHEETQQAVAVPPRSIPLAATLLLLAAGLAAWWWVYTHLPNFAAWWTYGVMGYPKPTDDPSAFAIKDICACSTSARIPEASISAGQRQGMAVAFLLYQLPHTFLLLFLVVFLMGIVRSFFTAEGTRRMLAGKHPLVARVLAAALGIVTPFCSCSAVPLFIGFVTAGVPLGATFTFLTAAPLVNEMALALLFSTFAGSPLQWPITLLYVGTGVTIALLTGWLMDRLRMERHVEPWVFAIPGSTEGGVDERLTFNDRVRFGFTAVKEIFGRVWLYILLGVGAGTLIFAFTSRQWLETALSAQHWWSVPLATVIGVPIYSSPAGILPVVQALMSKGVPIGTLLALLMAVIGLSLPEFIVLRKVLRLKLILAFAGIVAVGIMIVGFLFNLLFAR